MRADNSTTAFKRVLRKVCRTVAGRKLSWESNLRWRGGAHVHGTAYSWRRMRDAEFRCGCPPQAQSFFSARASLAANPFHDPSAFHSTTSQSFIRAFKRCHLSSCDTIEHNKYEASKIGVVAKFE